ncbi:unnamed protein product [Merluccius merluccius]
MKIARLPSRFIQEGLEAQSYLAGAGPHRAETSPATVNSVHRLASNARMAFSPKGAVEMPSAQGHMAT